MPTTHSKAWKPTVHFQSFRASLHELSKIYWTHQMGADSISHVIATEIEELFTVDLIACSFDGLMHPFTVRETKLWLPRYLELVRVHILVMLTGFLESYLKQAGFYWVASQGYLKESSKLKEQLGLSAVGAALAHPIVKSSTVPDMLKYSGELFSLDFDEQIKIWTPLYKIRCAAAHDGALATTRFFQDIGGYKLEHMPTPNERIRLSWDELRIAMRTADEVATQIDRRTANNAMRLIQVEQCLRELNTRKSLPLKRDLWPYVHTHLKIAGIKESDKIIIERKFYPKRTFKN